MPSSWYTTLVVQDPNNRYAIKRKNGNWIVVDYSAGLHVMNLHNEAKAFDLTIKDVFVTEEQNHNARYLFIRNQEIENSLIPLLPGYVEPNGKTLSPKPAQALILKSMEYKQTIYFRNKTIKMLKERIILLNGETENEKNDIIALNNLETQRRYLSLLNYILSKSFTRSRASAVRKDIITNELVIGFYTVENSRSAQKPGNDSSRIIHQENFDGSSRQMEYAILIALLNNIMPILEETDFTLHELVSYKSKTQEQICKNIFWPSFGDFLTDFNMIIKCVIFEFNEFQEDTFVSMKTGGGKTLCYAISICFNSLTIVFSPLKALMKNQKRELIKAGVPCATLYANLAQGACVQEKIFEEIACGLIKVLFVTPEKLVSNEGFCRFITQLYEQQKVHFKHIIVL
ncbi:hypothetical protein C1646_677301 [Rhizophagus diaphanus]|nr:hypothetical protein C1646_677301 [Rhizophagus diaphanus] [Rhizophagus sp. MUCL 43196]